MTVSTPEGELDPADFRTESAFKSAVYGAAGAGSWLDDVRLAAVWREANGRELEDHHEAVLGRGR